MKGTVYFATDHAGYELKEVLVTFVRDTLGFEVVDCGANHYDVDDDFPDYIAKAAAAVSKRPTQRAIILGGSGQGEAMVANRFRGVRATVFYGEPHANQTDASGKELSIVESSRLHNDANVLSLGARFLTEKEAIDAVALWLSIDFAGEDRHVRRIKKIDHVCSQ